MAGKKTQAQLTPEEKLQQALVPEAEQPYKVPDNWCWTYWGNCGEFIAGNAFKKDYQGFQNYHIPFYKVGSLKYSDDNGILYDNSNTINDEILKILKATLIPVNSIIFAKIGEAIRLNRRSINNKACCIDNNLMAFVSKVGFWKYFYFWSLQLDLYDYTNATTVPAIRKSDLEGIEMPLPPLAEQQRIVERIETLFAKLDEAKEKLQNTLDTFETRKAAILHKAFTGELTANWRKQHGISMDSWEEKKLGDCGSLQRGRSKHRPRNDSRLFGEKYPFIQTGDVANAEMYIINHSKMLSDFGLQQSKLFPKGTLCITIAANIGKVGILTYDCCFPDSVVGFLPNNENICEFIYYKLTTLQKELEELAPATAQKNINLKLLNDLKINMPTRDEQIEIVRIIDYLFAKEQQAKELAEKAIAKIDLIKKAILARAFRGELGTNNPADEPAIELLKRVL